MNNDLVEKAKQNELISVPDLIAKAIPELAKMLGNDEAAATRFARIITTDCRRNPKLFNCTPESFMGAIFTAAELKLEPIAGRAYILPFNNSKKVGGKWVKVLEAQFMLGYKGAVDLFYRHASALSISWGVVHENDEFDYQKGSNSFLNHKEALSDKGKKVAYWVGANVNGDFLFEVMSAEDCMKHGEAHSKTFYEGKFAKSSPWLTSPDSMSLKTVLFRLSKTLPLSVEVQRAIQADESTKYINPVDIQEGKIIDVLDEPDQTQWNAPENKEEIEVSEPANWDYFNKEPKK